jgi:hypothetical protein
MGLAALAPELVHVPCSFAPYLRIAGFAGKYASDRCNKYHLKSVTNEIV